MVSEKSIKEINRNFLTGEKSNLIPALGEKSLQTSIPIITQKVNPKLKTTPQTIPILQITPITTPIITQITTPITTPKLTPKTTPRLAQITQPELVPKIPSVPIEPIIPIIPSVFFPGPQSGRGATAGYELLGETKGFFGNVPQESISGIFGKRQEITYSEGYGLSLRTGKKQKKERRKQPLRILGGSNTSNLIFGGSQKRTKKAKRGRRTREPNLSIFGSGKKIKIF